MKHINQAQLEQHAVRSFNVELFTSRVQERFFGPGYHYKHVSTQQDVADFLNAIAMYGLRSVGFMSLEESGVPSDGGRCLSGNYQNVGHELMSDDEEDIAHWMAAACHYDYLVIDGTAELLQSAWFEVLERHLIDSGVAKNVAIVYLFRPTD